MKKTFQPTQRKRIIGGLAVKTSGVPFDLFVKLQEASTSGGDVALVILFRKHLDKLVRLEDGSEVPSDGLTVEILRELFEFAIGKDGADPL